ncbi:unnamed protein product [Blepharisma stoltei]|uniref:Myb-like domain-containing protein n=1 Tax=Blepharisma stoltei TaxID=1481888 RepID=A0AAU9J6A2_9CILI|nr:unnamed protein product [Blepharisma stoltei]
MKRSRSEADSYLDHDQRQKIFSDENINFPMNSFSNLQSSHIDLKESISSCTKTNKNRWSIDEDFLLLHLYIEHGAKWVFIASQLKNRAPTSIKNHFYLLRNRMTLEEAEWMKNQIRVNRIKRNFDTNNEKVSLTTNEVKDEQNDNSLIVSRAIRIWSDDIVLAKVYDVKDNNKNFSIENDKAWAKICELRIKEAFLENQLLEKKRELSEFKTEHGIID